MKCVTPKTRWWKCLGPGLITGASGNDPSGIATYAQTGALFGIRQLWTVIYIYPIMAVIQEICARIGYVTRKGLVGAVRLYYPSWVAAVTILLLSIANLINIGANIGAMGAAAQVMIPSLPLWPVLISLTLAMAYITIRVPYESYTRYLKYASMVLLVYIPTALWMDVRWIDYLKATLIPTFTFDRAYIMNIVAIMGTTISPYMFFWQSYQEGEEANHHPERTLGQVQCDTWIGMGFSNIISWFIIATAAGTIHLTDPDGISNAAEAAYALKPILGSFAALLFSSGIIGTALITIPVLAATISQAWCDLYEIPAGISLTYREGKTFYRMFAVILLAGLGINLIPVDPIDLLYYTAVINGVLSAPLFWFIAGIIQDERVFGPYTCSNWHKGVVVFGACILSLASLALLVDALM